MPDFDFKEFTPEEDSIYTEAVTKFREAITRERPSNRRTKALPSPTKRLRR